MLDEPCVLGAFAPCTATPLKSSQAPRRPPSTSTRRSKSSPGALRLAARLPIRMWPMRGTGVVRDAPRDMRPTIARGIYRSRRQVRQADAMARRSLASGYCICAVGAGRIGGGTARRYRELGYRLNATEAFMVHDLRQDSASDVAVYNRARDVGHLADRVAKASRARQALASTWPSTRPCDCMPPSKTGRPSAGCAAFAWTGAPGSPTSTLSHPIAAAASAARCWPACCATIEPAVSDTPCSWPAMPGPCSIRTSAIARSAGCTSSRLRARKEPAFRVTRGPATISASDAACAGQVVGQHLSTCRRA